MDRSGETSAKALSKEDQDKLEVLERQLFDDVSNRIRLSTDLPGLEVAEANRSDPAALTLLLRAQREHWTSARAAFSEGITVVEAMLEILDSGGDEQLKA